MSPVFLTRLFLDLLAAGLLLFAFSYWWLGNVAHELAGTAMFLLVIVHNVFNRRWYGAIPKARRDVRGLFNIVVTFLLLVAMLALLVTSVLISHALSGVMSPFGGFTVRQIHTLAAYWVLVIVAVHLGLRWPMLMGVARKLARITQPSDARTLVLRMIAILCRDPWRLEFVRACGRHEALHADDARLVELRGIRHGLLRALHCDSRPLYLPDLLRHEGSPAQETQVSRRDTGERPPIRPAPEIAAAGSGNRGDSRGTRGTNPPEPG